jgi:FAD/FMN-containing dehydrogenase
MSTSRRRFLAGSAASFAVPVVEPDTTKRIYRVSVGGTLSVNAHGWPVQFGPFGSTLQRFRIMLADGSVLTCSSTENAELQIDRTLARTDPQLRFRNALWDTYLA